MFAVIAAVLATNLYRILGKKTTSEKTVIKNDVLDEKLENSIFSDEVMDYSQKQIVELDKSFNFYDFLEGAQEAFKLIVNSYNNNKLERVKTLLSEEVFEKFDKSIIKDNNNKSFNIKTVKASILKIEVVKKLAKIKVEFLSNQESIIENKIDKKNNIKDIWTFEKNMENNSPIWTLIEVGIQ